jgi:hypothetical protein
MAISPTAREASLPTSSVKDQTAALFLEGAADSRSLRQQCWGMRTFVPFGLGYHDRMYKLKPGIKQDPQRRWQLPDRIFFGHGACHILAGIYLEAAPLAGFYAASIPWVKTFSYAIAAFFIIASIASMVWNYSRRPQEPQEKS